MKTAILVHGPDFACSENLVPAFECRGEARLFSLHDTDWRQYNPGTLITENSREECRAYLESADLVFLGDATAFKALSAIAPPDDIEWLRARRIVGFFGDSAYFKNSKRYDVLCEEIGLNPLFLLPNLMPLNSSAIPLHHPMPVRKCEKNERLTIAHSPGRQGKANQKGTGVIRDVLRRLAEEFDFDYVEIMYKTILECLQIKSRAHIFIDQLPPPGKPRGLGRSGLEAMSFACATLSALYEPALVWNFFEPPPVLRVETEAQLESKLRTLLRFDTRKLNGQLCSNWIANTVDFEQWIAYVEKYL